MLDEDVEELAGMAEDLLRPDRAGHGEDQRNLTVDCGITLFAEGLGRGLTHDLGQHQVRCIVEVAIAGAAGPTNDGDDEVPGVELTIPEGSSQKLAVFMCV